MLIVLNGIAFLLTSWFKLHTYVADFRVQVGMGLCFFLPRMFHKNDAIFVKSTSMISFKQINSGDSGHTDLFFLKV